MKYTTDIDRRRWVRENISITGNYQCKSRSAELVVGPGNGSPSATNVVYVAAKATYIRLLHGKFGYLGFFRP